MNYRTMKDGSQVSVLGYGCMRFTHSGPKIDLDKAESEVISAIDKGINYFDTAYIYPGSEEALGKILDKNNCRDKVYIATKLPTYMVKSAKAIDKYFNESLKRLKTDHIDYYLMHMLPDAPAWEKLKSMGIEQWLADRKADGSIRNVGFSFHGNTETFKELMDMYDWDFCQIQYNYLDVTTQAGREGLHYAAAKGVPVVIMEPLRGGKLVSHLPEEAKAEMQNHWPGSSPAEIAFRWLYDQPEVSCVLSGMNSLEMVEENCRVADATEVGGFAEEDHAAIARIRDAINGSVKVPCTACRYCMPCPHGVDIPNTFACYNMMHVEGARSARFDYLQITGMKGSKASNAGLCVGCRACEHHCPQHIAIADELKKADRALRPWYVKCMGKLVNMFLRF